MKGNKAEVRELGKEFRRKEKIAKLAYKDRVKEKFKFKAGSARDVWKWLNAIMGREQKQQTIKTDNPRALANDLNKFYTHTTQKLGS